VIQARGFRSGFGDGDVNVIEGNWLLRQYLPTGLDIRPSDIVIDIGAHIGAFTLYAAWRGAKVYAYEPDPDNYSLLVQNTKLNRLQNVRAFKLAVAGHSGRCKVPCWGYEGYYETDRVSLADVFHANALERCDFLKIDAEGAEFEIIFKAPQILKKISVCSLE